MKKASLKKMRIGVLMGGSSAEREVSLRSGRAVLNALKQRGYDAVAIDPASDLDRQLARKKVGAVFIALHGGHGENGAIQGMLEVKGIPYTGSGVLASALAMDKEASKKMFLASGVPVPEFRVAAAGARLPKIPFGLPWVVKPATEGSSVGVHIVKKRGEFDAAFRDASKYGPRIIVEQFVAGKEVQIGILNGKPLGGVEVRPADEFYSYKAKYTAGMTQYILPPEISKKAYRRCEEAAVRAHAALGCSGATRVDLILAAEDDVYVLEVNTIPGMTETSLLPKIAAKAGYPFPVLIEAIMKGICA